MVGHPSLLRWVIDTMTPNASKTWRLVSSVRNLFIIHSKIEHFGQRSVFQHPAGLSLLCAADTIRTKRDTIKSILILFAISSTCHYFLRFVSGPTMISSILQSSSMLHVLRQASRTLTLAPEINPPNFLKVFQVSSASVSFLASSVMAAMIALFGNEGLSTPYRRIIFGLSIADILQSFGLLTGPWVIPESRISEAGNEVASCQINGFLLSTGSSGVMMYTFLLCFYYLCKLKWKMSDDAIKFKIELRFHVFIVVVNLVIAFLGIIMDTFHTNAVLMSFCSFALVPTGCGINPDLYGECDPVIEKRVDFFINLVNVALPAVCLLGIIVTMSLLYHHAVVLHQTVQKEIPSSLRQASLRTMASRRNTRSSDEGSVDGHNETTPQDQVQHLSKLYRRETMIQASCYVGAFCITYVPMMTGMLLMILRIYTLPVTAIGIFCYPLGGFLNILVYTRPKVASIRRSNPECSRLRGLWLVIKAGGEIPQNIDVDTSASCNLCCCCRDWDDDSEYDDTESVPWTVYLFTHSRGGPSAVSGLDREAHMHARHS